MSNETKNKEASLMETLITRIAIAINETPIAIVVAAVNSIIEVL